MARDFDGSADYLTVSSAVITAYPATLAAWFKTSSFASGNYFFQFGNTGNAARRAGLNFFTSGEAEASVRDDTNTRTYRTTNVASTNTWAHIAGTFTSSSTIKAFLNGDGAGSYASALTATWPTFNNTTVGGLRRSSNTYSIGSVAEAAAWNVVLSDQELLELASGHSPLMVRPQSLVAYWPLFGRFGAAGDEEDWVGGNTLSQTSSPAIVDHPRIIYPRRRILTPYQAAAGSLPALTALTASNITTSGWRATLTAA